MSMSGNRRLAFRVSNPLVLDYEVLSEEEMLARMRDTKRGGFAHGGVTSMLAQMDNRIRDRLMRLRHRVPEAAAAVEAVNDKLNVLINLLPMIQHPGERLEDRPVRDGDLSASGIAFINEGALAIDTCMHIRVMLAPNYYYIEAFARVVRCEPHDSGGAQHRIGVQFELISDEQRELLVRYTMSREAELLRARRRG
jgi:c-di-GMP-binding flagellar brake protein YcgR